MESQVLEEGLARTMRVAETKAKDAWTGALTASLADLARKYALPQTFFVLADAPCQPVFESIVRRQDVYALRLGEKPFTVIGLKPSHIADHLIVTGEARQDVFLGMLALYAGRMVENKVLQVI